MTHSDPPVVVVPAKQGMRGGTKLFLGCMFGCGGLFLVCCGGITATTVYLAKTVSRDPQKIRTVVAQIADPNVPDSFKPAAAIDFKIPFTGQALASVVAFQDKDKQGMLLLAQCSPQMSSIMTPEGMFAQLENPTAAKLRGAAGGQTPPPAPTAKAETIKLTIRGEPAEFKLIQGNVQGSKMKAWQVMGRFTGKSGPAFLKLVISKEKASKRQVKQFLGSLG